jgi:ketosteroid isomerase-like protein
MSPLSQGMLANVIDVSSADERSLQFAGDVEDGRPLPMTVAVLQTRAAKWPTTRNTPENVAALLERSRRMFVDGYYTYENFTDAVTKSLQAVEAALRVRLGASEKATLTS